MTEYTVLNVLLRYYNAQKVTYSEYIKNTFRIHINCMYSVNDGYVTFHRTPAQVQYNGMY